MTAQQGIYASFGAHLSRLVSVQLDLDLGSYNTPSNGPTYLSHGVSLVLEISGLRVGGSWQQTSNNGGLSFQSSPSNFAVGDFQASSGSMTFEIKPPQVFSGFKLTADIPFSDVPCQ
jgi:hypothetical protein